MLWFFRLRMIRDTREGPKASGLTYKSRAKWKMLRGYCLKGIELLVHRCEKCVAIAQLFYLCHLKKLVRPETYGPRANNLYFSLLNNNKTKCQSGLTNGHLKYVMTLILSNISPKTEILPSPNDTKSPVQVYSRWGKIWLISSLKNL